jgi:hypothetical protein
MKYIYPLCALAVTVCLCALVLSVRATFVSLPVQFDGFSRAVVAEVHGTRTDLSGITVKADAQLTALRKDTLAEVREWRTAADRQLGDAIQRADARLKEGTDTVSGLREDLRPAIQHGASIAAQIDSAAPPFLDCEFNPDCAFNRFQGASKAFEKTMQAIAAEAPKATKASAELTTQAAGIATDVHTFTTRFVAPKPWYRRVWSAVVTGLDIVF